MLIEVDKVFVTASPLSELVWSPSKGLDLICTGTSSAENKNSLWWSTESFNMILSASECGIVGDDCHNGHVAEGAAGSIQLLPNSSSKNNMDVASPEKIVSDKISTNKLVSASSDDSEGPQQTVEVSMTDNQQLGKHFEDNESRSSSYGNHQKKCNDDSQHANSLSQEGVRVNTEIIKDNIRVTMSGVLPKESNFGNKNDQNSQEDKRLNSDTFLKVCVSSEKFMPAQKHDDSKHADKYLSYEEDITIKELPHPLTYFHPLEMQCSVGAENVTQDFIGTSSNQKPSFFNSLGVHRGKVPEVGASIPPMKLIDHAQESSGKNRNTYPEYSYREFRKDLYKRKGKEAIHEEIMGNSIEENHVSVESCNSKNFSTAKRARCIELEGESTSRKRIKEVACGNSLGLPFGQSSSFMKCISGIAKGLPCSFQTGRGLTRVPEPSDTKPGHSCSLAHLGRKGNNDSKTVGFLSFFEALYHPRFKLPQSLAETQLHHHEFNDSNKELQISNQPCGLNSCYMAHNEEGLKLHQPVPLSILSTDECHPEVGPNAIRNSLSNELSSLGKARDITTAHHVTCNQVSSSSSIWNGSNTAGDKGDSDICNKSSKVLTKNGGSEFLGSFWVTRLCPKVVPLTNSVQCNDSLNTAVERQIGSCKVDVPHVQDEECIDVDNDYGKYTTDNQERTSNPSDSCSLKRIVNDQKLNSSLRPILPSQRSKSLEPMASVFAKKLDTFRHIKTSGLVDNVLFSTVTCFFCGKMGHSLKECPDIKGSELEDLHKNINLYEGTKKSSCLCIRCFQMGHWAIACPLLSKKTNLTAFFNGKEIEKQPLNSTSLTIDAIRHEIRGKEGLSFNFLQNERADKDSRAFSLVQGSAFSPGERKMSGKQIAFHSRKNESEGYQIIPVNNFMRREKFGKHIRVFEGIRGLRLSRIELVREMKSRHSNLEGFFLRVRLGKYEEGTGRSGYHVACICGDLEKSHQGPRSHVSVDIVGLKCSIDLRFVSNNGFIEDELNDWWFATIKSGKKLPTEEEITKKLQERRKANF